MFNLMRQQRSVAEDKSETSLDKVLPQPPVNNIKGNLTTKLVGSFYNNISFQKTLSGPSSVPPRTIHDVSSVTLILHLKSDLFIEICFITYSVIYIRDRLMCNSNVI